jgi:hypothetical protein
VIPVVFIKRMKIKTKQALHPIQQIKIKKQKAF